MTRRSAIGVLNGNWKNRWKEDLDYWHDQKERIKKKNKLRFGDALDELKRADPDGWEDWFDNNENIPLVIYFSDNVMIDRLCKRMQGRILEVVGSPRQGAFQKIPPLSA